MNFREQHFTDDRNTAGNMRLAIAGGQWFIEVLLFYCKFMLADSLVLLNARHRQAQGRLGAIWKLKSNQHPIKRKDKLLCNNSDN
jgi:hypothetical protein